MNTDLEALQRMIRLPAPVRGALWQTGQKAAHGGDWWLAAVLQVDPAAMAGFLAGEAAEQLFDTPAGMRLEAEFAALSKLPGAQALPGGGLRVVAPLHGIAPYARSPLLAGHALRLADDRVLVVLWTR